MDDFKIERTFEVKSISDKEIIKKELIRRKKKKGETTSENEEVEKKEESDGHIDIYI